MSSACLFLKASSDACASEIGAIEANLKAVDNRMFMEVVEWKSHADFKTHVEGKKFTIIYLGAHADANGFGELNDDFVPWELFANAVCWTDCIIPGGSSVHGMLSRRNEDSRP